MPVRDVLSHPRVVARFQDVFNALAAQSTGSSTFVSRAIVLVDPPSMEAREITDKGSINQKAVLKHRTSLVDDMYAVTPPPHVLVSGQTAGAATPNR